MCVCVREGGGGLDHTIHNQEQLHSYHVLLNESDKDDGTNPKQM